MEGGTSGGGCDGASGLCRNVSGELQGSVPGPTKPDPLGIGSGRGLARFPSRQELSCQPRSPAVELHSHWVEVKGQRQVTLLPLLLPLLLQPLQSSSPLCATAAPPPPKPDNPAFKGQKTGAHSLNLQCAWTESKEGGWGGGLMSRLCVIVVLRNLTADIQHVTHFMLLPVAQYSHALPSVRELFYLGGITFK